MIDKDFTGTRIIQGDVLQVLREMPDGIFGGVITDPPYSSGGLHIGDRQKSVDVKYMEKQDFYVNYDDYKDQRSWTRWCSEWLSECRRVMKDGAPICVFIDWRQIPSLSDALQWAGFIWRGLCVWDKINARPQKGRFRPQAEFIAWGSKGDMALDRNAPCLPGVFTGLKPTGDKLVHVSQKPVMVLHELIKIVEPGEIILDPFCGSGVTLVAAAAAGYSSVGIDNSDYYADIARRRVEGLPRSKNNGGGGRND